MKNRFLTGLITSLVLASILFTSPAFATFSGPEWWQINGTPTTLSGYGITDAEPLGAIATHSGLDTGVHGVAGKVVGDSDVATLTNKHISGEQIDSGTVGEPRIDAAIARDSELPDNASFTFSGLSDTPATYTGQSLKAVRVNSGETALEYYTPTTGATLKRAEVTMGGAGTTVNFTNDIEGNAVAINDFKKCNVYLNGIVQAYANFTKTDANTIESTQGSIPAGTLVTLVQVD